MKWNNRLKSVLTPTAKSEFSEECLNSQLTKADKTPLKLVSSAFVSSHSRDSLKIKNDLARISSFVRNGGEK